MVFLHFLLGTIIGVVGMELGHRHGAQNMYGGLRSYVMGVLLALYGVAVMELLAIICLR